MSKNIGIIGNGYWGNKILSKLDADFVSFISSNPSEYYSLINGVDWVVIASPEKTHFEITKKSLLLGKNVFCEKPLALTNAEYMVLYELADKQGVYLYVDDVFNHAPNNFEFKQSNDVKWKKFPSHRIKEHVSELLFRLAYHDIYLLYPFLKDNRLLSLNNESTSSILKWTALHEGGITVSFEYDDHADYAMHKINGSSIGCSVSEDPLKKMLLEVFNFDADFDVNRALTLYVGEYLDRVKEIV